MLYMVKKNPLRAVLMLSGVLIAIVVIAVSSILAIGLYCRSSLAPAVNLPRMSPNLSNLPRTEVC
jgi:hypothetical protein